MADLTVSSAIDTFMQAADAPAARAAIGTSAPGLPVWTYTAGAMASGKVKTNTGAMDTTTLISLSDSNKNGTAFATLWSFDVGESVYLVLTSGTGKSNIYEVGTSTAQAGYVDLPVSGILTETESWSGDYQVSFLPNTSKTRSQVTVTRAFANEGLTPCADGTYTVGIGATNGTITTVKGIITAVQEAVAV